MIKEYVWRCTHGVLPHYDCRQCYNELQYFTKCYHSNDSIHDCIWCSRVYSGIIFANRAAYKLDIQQEIPLTLEMIYSIMDLVVLCEYKCAYCRVHEYECLDHFYPMSKGGSNIIHNLVPACKSCNVKKSNTVITYTTRDNVLWLGLNEYSKG